MPTPGEEWCRRQEWEADVGFLLQTSAMDLREQLIAAVALLADRTGLPMEQCQQLVAAKRREMTK